MSYFPKIGDELPYKLYKTACLSISKMNFKEYQTKYIFKYDINDEIKKLNEENKALKAEFKKKVKNLIFYSKKKMKNFKI